MAIEMIEIQEDKDNSNPFMAANIEFPDIPKLRLSDSAKIHTKTPLPFMHRSYVSPVLSSVGAIVLGRRTLARAIAVRTYLYNTAPRGFSIDVSMLEDPALVRELLESLGMPTDIIDFDGIMSVVRNSRAYARRLYSLRSIEDIDKELEAIENGTMLPPTSYDYLLHEITRAIWNPSKGGEVDTSEDSRHVQYLMISNDIVSNVGLVTDDIIETYDTYRQVAEKMQGVILPNTEILKDLMISSPTAAMELINASNAMETLHGSQIDGRSFWDNHNGTVKSYSAENELLFLERARINPSGPEMSGLMVTHGSYNEAGKWLIKRVDEIKSLTGSRLDFNKVVHQQVQQLKGYSKWITSVYNGTFLSLNDILGTTWELDLISLFS